MSSTRSDASSAAFSIRSVTVPDHLDSPDADDFIAMTEVRNAVESEQRGAAGDVFVAAEILPSWKDPSVRMSGLVADVGTQVVARGSLALPAGASECWAAVSVLPGFRQRGIGTALYERLERMARDAGRTTVQNQTTVPADVPGDRIAPPTGFGSIPTDIAATRFLVRHGFTLEQVGRLSELTLPIDTDIFTSRLREATAASAGYRTITWQGRTPEEWIDGLALLRTRMSTDTPYAGMEQTEDVWDADRVRSFDDLRASSPRAMLTTIAIHESTGHIAGYTELDVPADPGRAVEQVDTLVLRDHRGHRLGMLMKLVNLRELGESFPAHRVVETVNAEENRPMLDVNEAVGFTAVCFAARSKKAID